MNKDFCRILALLRKERNISQKKAAQELGVSQALLSHYEKGIRECGLDFLVRVANYYDVSCDYLLNRSPERTGSILNVEDIPEPELAGKENGFKGSLLPTLNKKLIANSLNIIYGFLSKVNHKELTLEVSHFLSLAVYRVYRSIYSANPKNPQDAFKIHKENYSAKVRAEMALTEGQIQCITGHVKADGVTPLENAEELEITPERLYREFPLFASSLANLIQNTEEKL